MSLYGRIRTALLADATLVTLLGGAGVAPDRITPIYLDEGAEGVQFPAVTIHIIVVPHLGDHLGGAGNIGLATVQVDCWAQDMDAADPLAAAVIAALMAGLGSDLESYVRRDLPDDQSVRQAVRVTQDCQIYTTEA